MDTVPEISRILHPESPATEEDVPCVMYVKEEVDCSEYEIEEIEGGNELQIIDDDLEVVKLENEVRSVYQAHDRIRYISLQERNDIMFKVSFLANQ